MARVAVLMLVVGLLLVSLMVSPGFVEARRGRRGREKEREKEREREYWKKSSKKGSKKSPKKGGWSPSWLPPSLELNFYGSTCPNAESIVSEEMSKIFNSPPDAANPELGKNVAPDMLRLHFHDCFVNGCDASVLLDGPEAEKMATPNVRLEGFNVVDRIKASLEAACPGVVSCADLLAFAARDAIRLTGGNYYLVPGGRRDGSVSSWRAAWKSLPDPQMSVDGLTDNFKKVGLTREDMVVLSGAHTIGDVACHHIDNRLYTYPSKTKVDPSLPPEFVAKLKNICPVPGSFDTQVDMDQVTPITFDTQYYKNLQERKSVLSSDQVLFTDTRTRPLVNKLANDPGAFKAAFSKAMVKMGNIKTLKGTAGQVRTNCRMVNSV